ncbi:hypothetical protein BGX24_009865 [Mortierella sp. AD032]|nr:hypothetical protein BGX24_009865 [Mortierella sp. AD032]
MTITTNNRRLSYTPSTTAIHILSQPKNNKQALSSTTIQTTWSKLPEVVRICNLPEYFPDDSFGRNAERNEKYARTRLVALREHQQILIGFLGHLLVIEKHQRSGEQLFAASIDPSFPGNNSTLAASSPTEKVTAAAETTTAAEATKVSWTDSRLDPTAAMVVKESESPCVCQKRHHRRLQKRDVAIRAYQRAILDLWQTDQNMCYWLSRYIRTTRHIRRGLEYMVAAMPESHINNSNNNNNNNNNNSSSKYSASPSSFKYPPYWRMTKEIDDVSFARVGVPWNDRPTSGVSNPELERMGILQSKLMDYSAASNSFVNDGGCSDVEGPSNGEPPRRPVALPDSSTLGDLHIQCSLVPQSVSMQELTKSLPRPQLIWSSEQHTIPTIRINSPELLFKPLPKLLDNVSAVDVDSSSTFPALSYRSSFASTTSATSMTSMTDNTTVVTAVTTTTGYSDTTVNTTNSNDDGIRMTFISGRIIPIFSAPLLSEGIRELVTSSAPITPPPAVPAPKRPRRPTFPILPPPPVRTRANVKIASTAFFPSVPSPSASTLFPGSQTCNSTTAAAVTRDAADAKLSSSTSSATSIRAPIHEFNPVDHRQDVHPFDSVPILSTSTKDAVFSGMKNLETDEHSATQPDMTFPALTAAAATAAATTTPAKKSMKAPSNNATTLQKIPHEYSEDDNINGIEASVAIGYHLQSLGKANEFLFQFNKESRRSFGVLKRFEVARQVFERRVLCQYADDGDGGGNDEYDSESEAGEERA